MTAGTLKLQSSRCVIPLSNGDTCGQLFASGPHSMQGHDGLPAPQGNPGDVSNADLTTVLGGTSANTNAISQLGLTVSDPPTKRNCKRSRTSWMN